MATGYELDGRNSIPSRGKVSSLLHKFHTEYGANQIFIQWVPRAL
jgi:hypothetical protein